MSGDQFRQIPQLRPYRPVTSGDLSNLGVVAEQNVPDEDEVVHNGILNHQFKNLDSFHLTFGHLITRRESDGLIVRETTGNLFGVSNFTSHGQLEPLLYRPDGLWRPGTPAHLLATLAALPGNVPVPWAAVPDKLSLIRGLFDNELVIEQSLYREFNETLNTMLALVEPDATSCDIEDQALLGAYGVVAYSDQSGESPVYAPETAAVLGSCDLLIKFGESGRATR